MKKQIIKLTEKDLHTIIKNSVNKILKEGYDDEFLYKEPYYDEPNINDLNPDEFYPPKKVWYNINTEQLSYEQPTENGLWVGVIVGVNDWSPSDTGEPNPEFWIDVNSVEVRKTCECFLIKNGQIINQKPYKLDSYDIDNIINSFDEF